jgi:hypothetical protein
MKIIKKLQKQILNFDNIDSVLDNIAESCNYEDGDGQFYNAIRISEDIILVLEQFWGAIYESEYYHYSISKNELVMVDQDMDIKYRDFFDDCDMLDSLDCFFVCGMQPTKNGKAEIIYGNEYNNTIINLDEIDVNFDRMASCENVVNCNKFQGFCLECGDDDLAFLDGNTEIQELACSMVHLFTIKSLGWEYTDNKKIK